MESASSVWNKLIEKNFDAADIHFFYMAYDARSGKVDWDMASADIDRTNYHNLKTNYNSYDYE